MKLLFVLPEFGDSVRGGIATFYNHLIPGLIRADCEIDVCLAHEHELPSDLSQQSDVRVFGVARNLVEKAKADFPQFAGFPGLQLRLARAFAAFRSCGEGNNYDVVETTDWGMLYVPWLLKNSKTRVVVQLHGSDGQIEYYDPHDGTGLMGLITRLLETSLLGRADELQSYGLTNADEWSRLLNKDVCHILPAWCPNKVDAVEPPPGLDVRGSGLVVGRIDCWKGPEVLCQAAEVAGELAPKILWVGRDSDFRRPRQSMSAFLRRTYEGAWSKTILPVGEMSRSITASIQANAKFVVVPSIWDTFNLAAVEAMWARKVLICSDGAGASSLIRHGENGFRFPARDPKRLAKLLVEVDGLSPEVRIQIGQKAHDTIARELDLDRICTVRIDRYRHLQDTKIVRREHRWFDSLFASDVPESPFAFLRAIPTEHLVNAIPVRDHAKWVLRQILRRLRNAIH